MMASSLAETIYIDLLDGSQTFVGVLMTLNVLCLFLDTKSNFLLHLIDYHTRSLTRMLSVLEQSVIAKIKDLMDSDEYGKATRIASYSSGVSIKNKSTAQTLIYELNVEVFSYRATVSESYAPIKSVGNYREQVLAPIYSLGFGLVIFLLDEIGRTLTAPNDIYVIGVWVFTMVSILYWTMVWVAFIIHSKKGHPEKALPSKWQRLTEKMNIFVASAMVLLICGALFWCAMAFIPWDKCNELGRTLLPTTGFVMPVGFIGLLSIVQCNIKGYYSYSHALGHLIAIAVYSVMVAAIYYMSGVPTDLTGYLTNIEALRFAITLFLLINGIVCPFCLPFFRSSNIYNEKRKEIMKTLKDIEIKIGKFKTSYTELIKKIGEDAIGDKD